MNNFSLRGRANNGIINMFPNDNFTASSTDSTLVEDFCGRDLTMPGPTIETPIATLPYRGAIIETGNPTDYIDTNTVWHPIFAGDY